MPCTRVQFPFLFERRAGIDSVIGKTKEYGVCEYKDKETAERAKRNLCPLCPLAPGIFSFSCRVVIDTVTGKTKGYGFCEYKDEETAESAKRNLQGYEVNGRQLRIDYADADKIIPSVSIGTKEEATIAFLFQLLLFLFLREACI